MSRYKNIWYGDVKKLIMKGYYLENTEIATRLREAMEEVEEQTLHLEDGEKRMKAVEEILIKRTKTYDGVALEFHYHVNVVKHWVSQYINQVGKTAGL